MKVIEDYKEMAISAYCRLSFEVWYQGYRDDILEYPEESSLAALFEMPEICEFVKEEENDE